MAIPELPTGRHDKTFHRNLQSRLLVQNHKPQHKVSWRNCWLIEKKNTQITKCCHCLSIVSILCINRLKLQNILLSEKKTVHNGSLFERLAEQSICSCLEGCLRQVVTAVKWKHKANTDQCHCSSTVQVSVFVYCWIAVQHELYTDRGSPFHLMPESKVSQPASWQSPWLGSLIKAICPEPTAQAVSTNTSGEGLAHKFDKQPTNYVTV